jgi:hypothetical protein
LSGIYAETLNSGFANPYAIISDFRAYSSVTRTFCDAAIDNNLPLALITDLQCPWARDYPLDLLQLKTDVGQFWDPCPAGLPVEPDGVGRSGKIRRPPR